MSLQKYRCWKRKKENGKKKNREKATALTTTEEINNQPKGANITTTTTTEDNSNQPKETTNTNDVPELSVESNPDDTEAEKVRNIALKNCFSSNIVTLCFRYL